MAQLGRHRPGRATGAQGPGGAKQQNIATVGQDYHGHHTVGFGTVEQVGQQKGRVGSPGVAHFGGQVVGSGHPEGAG